MNPLTRKIKDKGYSLAEFCKIIDVALRTYRRREDPKSKNHHVLLDDIDELEQKK